MDMAVYNGRMVVLCQIHGKLAVVADNLFADTVFDKCLLHQGIAAVFFTGEDAFDYIQRPFRRILRLWNVVGFEAGFDLAETGSGKVLVVYPPDDLSLFRDDLRVSVRAFPIAVEPPVLERDLAVPHGLTLAPDDVGGHGLALRLSEGSQHGDQDFAVRLQCINIFLLKDNGDSQLTQGTDVFEAVHRISGEAGDGFGQHDVYLLLSAQADHPQEFRPLPGGRAGYAPICEHIHHCPFRVAHDLVGVIDLLGFIACELLLVISADPTVGRYPQLAFHSLLFGKFRICGDDDDFRCGFCHDVLLLSMACPFLSRMVTLPFRMWIADTAERISTASSSSIILCEANSRCSRAVSYS